MTSKYSAALFAADKYHEIGIVRFPIYNCLVPAETRVINTFLREEVIDSKKYIDLAKKISKEQGTNLGDTLNAISDFRTGGVDSKILDYIDEIIALGDPVEKADKALEMKLATVTIMMQLRGEIKLPNATEYTRTDDWTDQDTEILQGFIDPIYKFAMWERNGWPQPESEGNDQTPTVTP
jgi:hypothetical protein